MPNTHTLTDAIDFSQLLAPAARTSTATGSTYVDMSAYQGGVVLLDMGAISGTTPTLDFKVVQATDSSGTSSKDLSGATLTQITSTGGSKQYAIEFRTPQLDVANGFTFVQVTATIAGTSPSFTCGSTLIRHRGRVRPVSTSLTQQVKV